MRKTNNSPTDSCTERVFNYIIFLQKPVTVTHHRNQLASQVYARRRFVGFANLDIANDDHACDVCPICKQRVKQAERQAAIRVQFP